MTYAIHLILAMGIGLFIFGVVRAYPYHKAKYWRSLPAQIISFSETWTDVVIRYGKVRYYAPKVEYVYDVDGVTYHSSRAGFKEQDIRLPAIDKWGAPVDRDTFPWATWTEGAAITVYVDPAHPDQAVIFREPGQAMKSQYLAVMFGGILLFAAWMLLSLV